MRGQWITKGKKPGSTRKESDNNLGYAVSIDQLHSVQLGLVQQFSDKIISTGIWDDQVMVDNFIDLIYVHLMRSTSQEETLTGKNPLKYVLPHF